LKKSLIILVVLILLMAKFLLPVDKFSAPVSLENIYQPSMFLVNYDKIYILENATIYIYSLKDFKLVKKFGKAGEGPQEFKYRKDAPMPMSISFYKNQLLVNSPMKVTYFDMDGNYIRELKVKTVDRILYPFDNKYIGLGSTPGINNRNFMGFTLFENDFNEKKVVFLSDFEVNNPRKIILPLTNFFYKPIYKGKIYINTSSDEFIINVYDKEGKQAYVIEKKYPKIKVHANYTKEVLEFIRKSPKFRSGYEYFKKRLKIREYFPPIRDIQMSDDFIYVITFKRNGELWECIKLDLKGNEIGRTFVKLNSYKYLSFYPLLYSVYKENIYSLVEDEEDETWKIHVLKFYKSKGNPRGTFPAPLK